MTCGFAKEKSYQSCILHKRAGNGHVEAAQVFVEPQTEFEVLKVIIGC